MPQFQDSDYQQLLFSVLVKAILTHNNCRKVLHKPSNQDVRFFKSSYVASRVRAFFYFKEPVSYL